jgi:hypothetical protein
MDHGAWPWSTIGPLYRAVARMMVALVIVGIGAANAEAERLTKRLPQLGSYNVGAYEPTPQNEALLREFVADVLTFVLLHETGHMVIHTYDIPVGTRFADETAADNFAAAVLTSKIDPRASDPHTPLKSAVFFWDAFGLLQQESQLGNYDWADEHSPSVQRAHQLACLLYGASPLAFSYIREAFAPREGCLKEAADNQSTFTKIISLHTNPNAGQLLDAWTPLVAVVHNPVPNGLRDNWSATLARERQFVQSIGILDVVAQNLFGLKRTDKDVYLEQIQRRLNKRPSDGPLIRANTIEHPTPGTSLAAYNYTVIGDSCLDKNGEPEINAYWNDKQRSVTLCYAMVAQIEYVGKLLIAADDCARAGDCAKLGSRKAPAPAGEVAKNLDPALVGSWALAVKGGRWILEISANGTFVVHSEANDGVPTRTGRFSAANGFWSLQATDGYFDAGSYSLQSPPVAWDAYSVNFKSTGTWRRVRN